ncbi:MAG TPA: Gfo/Idh/MocA family oxidoreductase [Symbiobacteriaceae bacterium]|nr:Gfo/Idh/MocA family oxidoreductase [Symbiobacteriaceae bacterium]
MRIAVVGLGSIARTHISALRALPAVRRLDSAVPVLHTLVTRRPSEVADEAQAMGFTHITSDLDFAEVDAVDICTPNALHREAVEAAVAQGKAIYCEKPLAGSLADAEAIAATGAGVVNQVALIYRYHPAVIRIKALLELGAIGQLLQFRAAFNHSGYLNPATVKGWRSRSDLSGGGGLLDLGVHSADVLQLLVGPLTLQHSDVRTLVRHRAPAPGSEPLPVDVDDWALLHLEAPGGLPGIMETSRIALGNEHFTVELYGTGGSIVCDLSRETAPRFQTFGAAPPMPEPPALQYQPPARLSLGRFVDNHQAALLHFLLRCTGSDPTPGWAPTFGDSLAAERVIYSALMQ